MIINNTVGRGGSSGKDGTTPHIGANGNWYLGETDTGVLAKAQGNTEIAEITLLASNWDESLNQTVACEGISKNEADQMVTLLPSLSSKEEYSRCRISCTAFAENSLTFTAESLPTEDITVFVAMEGESAAIANNVYSTEETVVGTWIDGKPIYKVTIPFSESIPPSVMYATSIGMPANFENAVRIYGIVHVAIAPKYHREINDGTFQMLCDTDLNKVIVFTQWSGSTQTFSGYVALEYTKTTDAATIAIPSATALAEAYEEGVNEA